MRIRPLLVTVPGAILPAPYGGQDCMLMVYLDQQKLLARQLTASDIHNALRNQTSCCRPATIKIKATDWMVQTNATPMQIEHFDDIPIKREGNAYIYMRDVADVRLVGPPQTNCGPGGRQTGRHDRRDEKRARPRPWTWSTGSRRRSRAPKRSCRRA